MMTEPNGVSLSQFSSGIANSAAELAVSLRKIDKKHDLKRDDALATAFPAGGKRRHKSIERYISQFIAQVTRNGKLTGLPADLKLIAKTDGAEDLIVLTDAGWEFAILQNPILDGTDMEPPPNLTQEEKDYLINHILRKVPIERSTYSAILECVLSGSDSPTLIDAALKGTVPREKLQNLSESFLSSQRSGAISRMVDLGIVARERDGIYVKYSLTPTSELFNKK